MKTWSWKSLVLAGSLAGLMTVGFVGCAASVRGGKIVKDIGPKALSPEEMAKDTNALKSSMDNLNKDSITNAQRIEYLQSALDQLTSFEDKYGQGVLNTDSNSKFVIDNREAVVKARGLIELEIKYLKELPPNDTWNSKSSFYVSPAVQNPTPIVEPNLEERITTQPVPGTVTDIRNDATDIVLVPETPASSIIQPTAEQIQKHDDDVFLTYRSQYRAYVAQAKKLTKKSSVGKKRGVFTGIMDTATKLLELDSKKSRLKDRKAVELHLKKAIAWLDAHPTR